MNRIRKMAKRRVRSRGEIGGREDVGQMSMKKKAGVERQRKLEKKGWCADIKRER